MSRRGRVAAAGPGVGVGKDPLETVSSEAPEGRSAVSVAFTTAKDELWLLDRMLYKAHNQHRRTRHFSSTSLAASRCRLAVDGAAAAMSTLDNSGSGELAKVKMVAVVGAHACEACVRAGKDLLDVLAMGHFATLCVTLSSVVARLLVCMRVVMECSVAELNVRSVTVPASVSKCLEQFAAADRRVASSSSAASVVAPEGDRAEKGLASAVSGKAKVDDEGTRVSRAELMMSSQHQVDDELGIAVSREEIMPVAVKRGRRASGKSSRQKRSRKETG